MSEVCVPNEFDDDINYDITFWAKNDTNKTQIQIYEDAIASFQKYYPNITVNIRLYNDYGKIYNDVITNIGTGTTPNVCITYPDHIATYLSGENTVVPLDDLIDDPGYGLGGEEVRFDSPAVDEIVPSFLEECKINGVTYAMPFMRSTEACYINKTYVEKLGYKLPQVLTWDFVWEVSEAATKKNSDGIFELNGQKVMIPFVYKSTDNMMIQSLHQLGGEYSSENGDILLFNDTTKSVLEDIALHTQNGAFSTFKISGYPGNFLNAGQCVFAVDSTAGATWMGTNAPMQDISEENIVHFETAVMPIPQYDIASPSMISQGPSVCIFNKEDSGEVMASWLFVQYLLSNEVQIAYSQTEGYVPVTLKAQNSDEYLQYIGSEGKDDDLHYDIKIKASKLLLDNMNSTFVTPVFAGSASLRDASGQLIEHVTKAVRRNQTVDDAYISKLYDDMISLYRLDEIGKGSTAEKDFGPLPYESVVLLMTLAIVWIFLALYFIINFAKKSKYTKK